MQIMTLNQVLVDRGRTAFNLATIQFLCGPNSSVYTAGKRRLGGIEVVPGAIVAAIEQGLNTPFEIIPAVARVSRCYESTVKSILEGLAGEDVPDRLWAPNTNGTYSLTDNPIVKPFTVMTS